MRVFVVALTVSATLLSIGCSDDPTSETDADCRLNSDCPNGQLCQDGACIDSDRCEGLDCPCESEGDCAAGLVCDAIDGRCTALRCAADVDCGLGEVCAQGLCITDVDADRDLDGVPDGRDSCPDLNNPDQEDNDGDGAGDACDNDDDNDALPDTVDNCPLTANPVQGDADGNGQGNACDADTAGIGVRGTLDFSALPSANTGNARVFIAGRNEPVGIDDSGVFAFDTALAEPGRFLIRVDWPRFAPLIQEFAAPDRQPTVDVGTLRLTPANTGDNAIRARGTALLEGAEDHRDIIVRVRAGGALVNTTLTDATGDFVLALAPSNHTLSFSKVGFEDLEVTAVFNTQGDFEGRFTIDDVPLEEAELTLAALPAATLTGEVASAQGPRNDWPNIAFATLTNGEFRRIAAVGNANEGRGQFQLTSINPGTYTLSVVAQGHLPFDREITLEDGDNALDDAIELVVEAGNDAVTLRGRVQLQGEEGDDGDNGGVSVAATVAGNLVATSSTAPDGAFAFPASRQDHRLSLSKEGFIPRDVDAIWNEVEERFEVGGEALEGQVFVLNQSPQSDRDSDGVIDALDNCPRRANPNQEDIDGDRDGDACDSDIDGDGMVNGLDNCPFSHNPMQEDVAGLGRGVVCSAGSLADPIFVGCGVRRQRLDTRGRHDQSSGSCGGFGSSELVYTLEVQNGESWSLDATATHPIVTYLLDSRGNEVLCHVGGRLDLPNLPTDSYTLVLDGFIGEENEGPINVSIASPDTCPRAFASSEIFYAMGAFPTDGTVEDFDKDGHLDVVTVDLRGNSVHVRLGEGSAQFGSSVSYLVGDAPYKITTGDLDRDGFIDIVTANNDDLSVLLGDGQGAFAPHTTVDVPHSPTSIALGDLNGDGFLDAAVTSVNFQSEQGLFGSVVVLFNDGQGSLVTARSFAPGRQPMSIALGDLNGDGYLDITHVDAGNDTLTISLNDGLGGFQNALSLDVGRSPNTLLLDDINGDGRLDAIMTNTAAPSLSVLAGDGVGGFVTLASLPIQGRPVASAVGDLNADQIADVVILDTTTDSAKAFLGNGDGSFRERGEIPLGDSPEAIVLNDIDKDLHLDMLIIERESRGLSIFKGWSTAFHKARTAPFERTIKDYELGDYNSDGLLDAAITGGINSSRIDILVGTKDGFEPGSFASSGGSSASDMTIDDFNLDNNPDIAVANGNSGNVGILIGDGRGGFTRQALLPVGDRLVGPRKIATGDFNSDNNPDIAVANRNNVSVLLADGDGSFLPFSAYSIGPGSFGEQPSELVIGDLNGDGHDDIMTSNSLTTRFAVLFGDGQGDFGDLSLFGSGGSNLSLGDLNQDTHLDVATNNGFHFGVGDGTFGALVPFPMEDFEVVSTTLLDVDGDGRLDVIAASLDETVLLQNNRLETPHQPVTLLPNGGRDLKVADLDSNGTLEIISRSLLDDGLEISVARQFQQLSTRPMQTELPACGPLQAAFSHPNAAFTITQSPPCAIERAEFLKGSEDAQALTAVVTPLGRRHPLATETTSQRLRPEDQAQFTRLGGHPANGTWSFNLLNDTQVEMHINTYPDDPFSPDTLAPICTANTDQGAEPEEACRLSDDLDGLVLEGEFDEDVFLLEGDFDGAFIRGQTVEVMIEAAPGSDIEVGIHAFRARNPLATAEEVEPGLWMASLTIGPAYSSRYFAVHIKGGADLTYSLSAGLQ